MTGGRMERRVKDQNATRPEVNGAVNNTSCISVSRCRTKLGHPVGIHVVDTRLTPPFVVSGARTSMGGLWVLLPLVLVVATTNRDQQSTPLLTHLYPLSTESWHLSHPHPPHTSSAALT